MEHVSFRGNYDSWAEARSRSTGYEAPLILDKVRAATLAVIAGNAACERDSVAFQTLEYSLPLLVCLLYVASRSGNQLNVLDFGGSLGSSYWQNRKFLDHMAGLSWSIVEQPHFVRVGQEEIQNEILKFYGSVDECLARETPSVVLLSGVLQSLEKPFDELASILSFNLRFVVFDRMQFFVEDLPDRITVEYVHASVYEASYPSWFFNLQRFREFIRVGGYRVVEEFNSWENWNVDGDRAQNKCLLLEKTA